MGIIDDKSAILLDTNSIIYYFENNQYYADKLESIFEGMQNNNYKGFLSIISLLEILVKPKKENNAFLENRYKLLLTNYPNLVFINVDYRITEIAARLRAAYDIKTPDAIIIATGIFIKTNYFITNDKKLKNICLQENIRLISFEEL